MRKQVLQRTAGAYAFSEGWCTSIYNYTESVISHPMIENESAWPLFRGKAVAYEYWGVPLWAEGYWVKGGLPHCHRCRAG